MIADIVKPANRKQTKTVNASATTTQYVYPDAGKDLTKVTVNGLTASAALGNAATDDVAEGKTFSSSNGILLTGTGAIIPNAHVYGAEWAGGSDPSWTRTDESANFSDPNPYYSGMSTTPSSPFDGLMPWAGMRRVSDTNAGELVEIPKFWYKWTRDGAKMKLQIADNYKPGFYTSPAHADRGDGVGERDYVYIGRYHCASDYLSKTNVLPKNNTTFATFNSGIHNLRSNIWMQDFSMWWTIRMLYLVEFANWNSQAMIGYGCGTGSLQNSGLTDNMSYHTGTMLTSKTTFGAGIQYRYIEDPWANGDEYFSGLFFLDSSPSVYARMYFWVRDIEHLIDYVSWGTYIGQVDNYNTGFIISSWTTPPGSEQYWLPAPKNGVDSSYTDQYVTDYCSSPSSDSSNYPQIFRTGGIPNPVNHRGFFFSVPSRTDLAAWDISSRLMVMPSQRIN